MLRYIVTCDISVLFVFVNQELTKTNTKYQLRATFLCNQAFLLGVSL